MTVCLSVLLILSGLLGIQSITTVSKVSVKAGQSISIPCLYDSEYRNNVKFLCKGYSWNSCSYAIKTNQQSSEKFSISDDKNQRIFTVTIKDLTDQDAHYWCAVEIDGGLDHRQYFQLSVTKDTPSLYVDQQEITAFIGEKLTIKCYGKHGEWCRLGGSCVTGSSGSIDGTSVTIERSQNDFTVTMTGLGTANTEWYLCASGDFQMPVHITVLEKPTTTTLATSTSLITTSPAAESGTFTITATTVQIKQQSDATDLKRFIIPLSLLIFIVIISLFIWFILKKGKQTKASSSAMTAAEEEVTYSSIVHKRKPLSKTSYTESNVDVLYSSVVPKQQRVAQKGREQGVTHD